jgi:hypothetical protein
VLDLRLAAGAPLLGAAIGLAAGTYPAWRASAIHLIDALSHCQLALVSRVGCVRRPSRGRRSVRRPPGV